MVHQIGHHHQIRRTIRNAGVRNVDTSPTGDEQEAGIVDHRRVVGAAVLSTLRAAIERLEILILKKRGDQRATAIQKPAFKRDDGRAGGHIGSERPDVGQQALEMRPLGLDLEHPLGQDARMAVEHRGRELPVRNAPVFGEAHGRGFSKVM